HTAETCIARLAVALSELHANVGHERQVIGIGVGVPGGVNQLRDVVQFAPNLGWHDVPFATLLGRALRGTTLDGLPLVVRNEADVAAIGELEFNSTPDANPLIYVSVNQGLGAGVIVGDRVLTGSRGYAGEVGHMVLQFNGPRCSCGRRGCAEALIATGALLRMASKGAALQSIDELRARLADQDDAALKAVASAGRHLGMLLLNLAAAYDPGSIILGGAAIEIGAPFLQPALSALSDFAKAGNSPEPTVRTSRFGVDAVAIGAAALVRHSLTRPTLSSANAIVASAAPKEHL
ncbi:ROK family protein, partial [Roseateles saccharophilus]